MPKTLYELIEIANSDGRKSQFHLLGRDCGSYYAFTLLQGKKPVVISSGASDCTFIERAIKFLTGITNR